MKVAILQTGAPPPELEARFGSYPEMIMAMIGDGYHTYEVIDARTDPLPDYWAHHGVIITGSPSGVYDGEPWIAALMSWLNGAVGRCKLVGICFGHQVMAQAFGGIVQKSEKGWGIGLQSYRVERRYGWMDPPAETISLPASHQDQVVYRGQSTFVSLTSEFCPYAGLEHGADAISFQGHPEFTPEFTQALIEARRGSRYEDAFADAAIESLKAPSDREVVAQWIRNFLREPVSGANRIGPANLIRSGNPPVLG